MPAFVLLDLDARDEPHLPRGGHTVVRGGGIEVLEGSWRPRRLVVLEFPDKVAARTWFASVRDGLHQPRAILVGAQP